MREYSLLRYGRESDYNLIFVLQTNKFVATFSFLKHRTLPPYKNSMGNWSSSAAAGIKAEK
jgi:hypothetical protein